MPECLRAIYTIQKAVSSNEQLRVLDCWSYCIFSSHFAWVPSCNYENKCLRVFWRLKQDASPWLSPLRLHCTWTPTQPDEAHSHSVLSHDFHSSKCWEVCIFSDAWKKRKVWGRHSEVFLWPYKHWRSRRAMTGDSRGVYWRLCTVFCMTYRMQLQADCTRLQSVFLISSFMKSCRIFWWFGRCFSWEVCCEGCGTPYQFRHWPWPFT